MKLYVHRKCRADETVNGYDKAKGKVGNTYHARINNQRLRPTNAIKNFTSCHPEIEEFQKYTIKVMGNGVLKMFRLDRQEGNHEVTILSKDEVLCNVNICKVFCQSCHSSESEAPICAHRMT